MASSFTRSIGPKADVAELEYVAALHQTCAVSTRPTGTISSLDILRYLKSRHALEISHALARDIVLALGGGRTCQEVRVNLAAAAAEKLRAQVQAEKTVTRRERWRGLGSSLNRHSPKAAGSSPCDEEAQHDKAAAADDARQQQQQEKAQMLVTELLSPKLLYLDIVQMTSVIFIPTLARMAKQWYSQQGLVPPTYAAELKRFQERNDIVILEQQKEKEIDKKNGSTRLPNGVKEQPEGIISLLSQIFFSNISSRDENVSKEVEESPEEPSKDNKEEQDLQDQTDESEHVPSDPEQLIPSDTSEGLSSQRHEGNASLSPQPEGLLELVLQSMWSVVREQRKMDGEESSTGSTTPATSTQQQQDLDSLDAQKSEGPPLVTRQMIRTLLVDNGEMERAHDSDLIERMVEVATSAENPGRFDESAFVRALTADLQDWDVGCEDRQTTYVYDIFGDVDLVSFARLGRDYDKAANRKSPIMKPVTTSTSSLDKLHEFSPETKKDEDVHEEQNESKEVQLTENFMQDDDDKGEDFVALGKKASYKMLDTVVDSSGSNFILLLAWMAFIGSTGTYASLVLQMDAFTYECDETFGCILGRTIVSWTVIALLMTIFGFFVLLPLLYGNHPTKRGQGRMFVASILAGIVTITPFATMKWGVSDVDPDLEELATSWGFEGVVYLTTCLGLLIMLQYFVHFLIAFGRNNGYNLPHQPWIDLFTTTSDVVGTARNKQAGTRKVNDLLTNARAMHGTTAALSKKSNGAPVSTFSKSESDAVFQNYTLRGESFVEAASLFWVWERIISGELFDTEGIWLPSRLIIFHFGQMIVAMMILFLLFFFVEKAAEAADETTSTLPEGLPLWIYELVPTGAQVRWALIPAASVSVAMCVVLIVIYIPSTVKTVLRYRCGQLGALGDETFKLARDGPDAAYMNTANAIYGMVATAALFFFLIGLLLFLFIWDFSRSIVLLLLAWGIGLAITIGIKMIITSFCRKRFFRAFYRVHPGKANLSSLALECWFIGLGGGVLVGRITQFLLASAFWIGRIDEPFLADNVSLLGYKFDYVPLNYIKEILVHEAHRHPYIERLGAMYLTRLRYRSFASSDACACWRQLFVLTLMPWLMKYRVFHEQRCLESLADQASEKEVQVEEDREPLGPMTDEILAATFNLAGVVDQGGRKAGEVGFGALDMAGQVGFGAVDMVDQGTRKVGQASFDVVDGLFSPIVKNWTNCEEE